MVHLLDPFKTVCFWSFSRMAGAGWPETVQELSDRGAEGPLQPARLGPQLPQPGGPDEPPQEADPAHGQHQFRAEALLPAQAPRSVSLGHSQALSPQGPPTSAPW